VKSWEHYFLNADDLRWALHVAEAEVRPLSLVLDEQHAREGRGGHLVSAGVFISLLRHMAKDGTSKERVKELVDTIWDVNEGARDLSD
jgi:hypothetical protein